MSVASCSSFASRSPHRWLPVLLFAVATFLTGCGQKVPTFGELTGQTKTEPAPPPVTAPPPAMAEPAAPAAPAGPLPEEVIASFNQMPSHAIEDANVQQLLSLPSGLQAVSELNLAGSKVTSGGLAGIEKLPNLKKLDVMGTAVDDAGLAHIGQSATLEELYLTNTKVTAQGLSQLANLKTLGKLVLEDAQIDLAGWVAIGNAQTLRTLHISRSRVTDEACQYIGNLVELEELSMNQVGISDNGLAQFKRLNKLKHLYIAYTTTQGEGLLALAKGGTLKNLETLVLFATPLTDPAGKALMQLKNLRRLNLGSTSLKDRDLMIVRGMTQLRNLEIREIATLDGSGFTNLQAMKYLERIDITNCRGIGDKALVAFKNIKTMREIVAGGSSVTEQGALALKKFLPDCNIGVGL
jgi:hypothetical protein